MTSRIATVAAVGFLAATIWLSLRASDQPQLPPLPPYTRPTLAFLPEIAQLPEHTQSFSYSADGTRIFTFGYDVREWDAATLKPRGRFVPEYRGIHRDSSYVFAPGEQTLVGFGRNPDKPRSMRDLFSSELRLGMETTIFVWTWGEPEAKFVFKDAATTSGHYWRGPPHAFSSDGRYLALVGIHEIAIFDVTVGKEVARLKHKDYWFMETTVWFTADDQSLVLLTNENPARWIESRPKQAVVERWKWTDTDATPMKVAKCLGVPAYHVVVSPDKRWLVGSKSWTEQFTLHTVETHNGGMHRYHSSRDVEVWNLATGEKVTTFDAGDEVAQLWFDQDGSLWTLGNTNTNEGAVPRRWELPSGKLLHEVPVRLDHAGFALSPDGRTLAQMAFMEDRIRRWDVQTGRSLDPVPDPLPGYGVRFSPDGAELHEWAYPAIERRWDAKTGRYLGGRPVPQIPTSELGRIWPSETGLTVTTAFDPMKSEHAVAVWDTATRQKLADLPPHPGGKIQTVIVAPDRTWILVWGAVDEKSCYLRRWNLATLQLGWDVQLPVPQRPEVSISPDGKSVYLGDWHVHAFDAETGRERFKRNLFDGVPKDWLMVQTSYGRNACWLADGRLVRSFPKHGLAIAHPDTNEFRLLELANAQALGASLDGKRLAVAGRGEDTTIRVFETAGWTEIWSGRLSSREVEAMRFSPNGRRLIAPSQWPAVQTEVFDLPE